MMKDLLTISAFLVYSFTAKAQCIIDQNVFSSASGYGLVPTSDEFNGSSNATATELTPYNFTLQIHLIPDTATSLGTFSVDHLVIDSIIGLPDGITYNQNPAVQITGGGYGCIGLNGTPTAGTASGGINNDGVYPIVVFTTMTVVVFSVPTDFPYPVADYEMRVVENTSGLFEQNKSEPFTIVYNGTNANAYVLSNVKDETEAELIDLNGNIVQSFTVYEGTNTLETGRLHTGMYFVKVGNSKLRLIKF